MRIAPLAALAFLLSGCAHAPRPEPLRLRAADLARGPGPAAAEHQPVIVEFDEGDVIPFVVRVSGDLVESPEGLAPIALRVKQRFFVRFDERGMKVSLDGVDFSDAAHERGSFQLGMGVTREGAKATLQIVTPSHRP